MKCAAGITLYNPEIDRLRRNLDTVYPQVEKVFLVDNGSSNIDEISLLLSLYDNIQLIENKENLGVAKALNQLCQEAMLQGFKWIILLDQDSYLEDDVIEKYCRYTEMEKVALITANFEDENEPIILNSETKPAYEQIHRAITSASFTRLDVWKTVGGFDEEMFIDCVDFDYCTTIEEHGYVILRDNEALVHHRLGHSKEVKFFMFFGRIFGIKKLKKPFYTYNHSPIRTYYYARNLKYYVFKHKGSINRFAEWVGYIKWFVLKLGFEDQKTKKLRAIIKGRIDANKMIKKLKQKQM